MPRIITVVIEQIVETRAKSVTNSSKNFPRLPGGQATWLAIRHRTVRSMFRHFVRSNAHRSVQDRIHSVFDGGFHGIPEDHSRRWPILAFLSTANETRLFLPLFTPLFTLPGAPSRFNQTLPYTWSGRSFCRRKTWFTAHGLPFPSRSSLYTEVQWLFCHLLSGNHGLRGSPYRTEKPSCLFVRVLSRRARVTSMYVYALLYVEWIRNEIRSFLRRNSPVRRGRRRFHPLIVFN